MPRVDPVLQYLRDRPTPLLSTDPTFHPSAAQPDRLVVSVSLRRFGRVAEFGVRRRPPYAPPPVVAQGRDRYQNVGLGLGSRKYGTLHEFACHPCAATQASLLCIVPISFQFLCHIYGGILGRTAAAISPPPVVAQSRDRYQNVALGLGRPANRTNRTKIWNASRICVSSLRRGHANLLCIVPILVYVPPKRVH